jgi:NADPH:quinone reductase-like Zn-dependent oxidoreductase
MQAIYLVKNGPADIAFEFRDFTPKVPSDVEVGVSVEAFGINFADVTARLGNYKDCPPLPAVVGYEAVGRVDKVGKNVKHVQPGQRVVAFSRFGGYSQYVTVSGKAVAPIAEGYDTGKALALATQYCTAYYAFEVGVKVFPGEKVLIQAAAGGVGTALVQLAKLRGCYIYGTAGSDKKLDYLRNQGVDQPINYVKHRFWEKIKEPIDVAFDSVGGETFRRSLQLLNKGGRMVSYGAAAMTDAKNIFSKASTGLAFGIFHPAQFIMESRSLVGVNMLRIADYKEDILAHCLQEVCTLADQGKIDPQVGGVYAAKDIAKAHADMENRKTTGKLAVKW